MNSHDSFCRGLLSDVPTFLELARFLTTRDAELDAIFNLLESKLKANAEKGIPSVAIILYNGKDNWNPLKRLKAYPRELQRYLLPFKCILLNVKDISDPELDGFGARLAAFICAMKYIWNPEGSRDTFKKILERVRNDLPDSEALDLLLQMDVYLKGWLKVNSFYVFGRN